MSDLIDFALVTLDDTYKHEGIIHSIALEIKDSTLGEVRSMYIVGQAAGSTSRLAEVQAASMYVLCSPTNVWSAEKCHHLYYHPPGYLGHKRDSSRSSGDR